MHHFLLNWQKKPQNINKAKHKNLIKPQLIEEAIPFIFVTHWFHNEVRLSQDYEIISYNKQIFFAILRKSYYL